MFEVTCSKQCHGLVIVCPCSTVETAYNECQGGRDNPLYKRNIVTKCSILMTKVHIELTNGDLHTLFNKREDKMNLKKVYLRIPELKRKNSAECIFWAITTPQHAQISSTLCLNLQCVRALHWLCSCYLNVWKFHTFAIHVGESEPCHALDSLYDSIVVRCTRAHCSLSTVTNSFAEYSLATTLFSKFFSCMIKSPQNHLHCTLWSLARWLQFALTLRSQNICALLLSYPATPMWLSRWQCFPALFSWSRYDTTSN